MGDEGVAEQRLTKASFYAQVGGPLVVDLNEAIDILTEENASLRAEVALLHQANKEHLVIAEKLNSECQRNEYLKEQVERLEKERDGVIKFADHLTDCDIWRQSHRWRECTCGFWKFCPTCRTDPAAEARIRELEGRE